MSQFDDALKAYNKARAELMDVSAPAMVLTQAQFNAKAFSFQQCSDYVLALTEKMYRHYGITNAVTQIRKRLRRSYHTMRDGKHLIRIGKQNMEYIFTKGFSEYKTIRYVINWGRPFGMDGIHQLVLHEFAHILACRRGYRTYGSVHNAGFVKVYRELMDLFSYGNT